MHRTFRLMLLLMALLLPACQAAPTSDSANQSVVGASAAGPAPSATPAPTLSSAPSATQAASATPVPATATLVPTAPADPTPSTAASPTAAPSPTTAPSATPAPAATAGSTAEGIAIRPDLAGMIAFVRGSTIYGYQPQTGAISVLVENGRDVRFSPDGTQLAFVRDDGLYLAAADGSNPRQVAAQTNVRAPRWTDDASKLVWERVINPTGPGTGEIWTVELPDGAPLRIAQGADPAWAPDGKRIAYVTAATGEPRRNELRLTNWRGENDWGVIRQLAPNTPALGIPGNEVPPANLEHVLFAPVWDAAGRSIVVPAFMIMQVETDFVLLERADADNGGSTVVDQLPHGVIDAIGAPDRQAVLFSAGSARGDVQLSARPIAGGQSYSWASTREVAVHLAPAWSPGSDAIVFLRCPFDAPNRCDLVLLQPGLETPAVLIPDVLAGQGPDYTASGLVAWGR